MVPEVKTIDPQYLAVQQTRFDSAAHDFGQTYSRKQNILSTGTDIIRRITGRPTLQQEIAQSIANVTERRLDLVETTARLAVQGIVDDATYLRELANRSAHAYTATGEAILAATQAENNNLGFVDDVYRANLSIFGSAIRFMYGGLAYVAASSANYDPQTAAIMAEAGIFLAATGGIDAARSVLLDAFKRNDRGANVATSPNLIRRKASIHEGQITGDIIGDAQAINQVLEQRLAQQILAELQVRGVRRPNFLNPIDFSDILAQREALRAPMGEFDHLAELGRSQDIARVSRLTRTLLGIVVAGSLLYAHSIRPEYCGTGNYANPDEKIGAVTGVNNISSLRGLAQSMWFERIYGRPFDPESPQDHELFDTTYSQDPKGNDEIVDKIGQEIRQKNPNIQFVTKDLFRHGAYLLVCGPELDKAYK